MLFAEPGVKARVFSWAGLKSRKPPGGCCSCAALSRIALQDTKRCRITLFVTTTLHVVVSHPPCILQFKECGMVTVNTFVLLQTAYVSIMCYNFGIDMYNARKFEESAFWLR